MNDFKVKTLSVLFVVFSCCLTLVNAQLASSTKTILIVGGTVIDGSGAKGRRADVRISGDRIIAIGSLKPNRGEQVIEATGKIVAPGFIDIHNHSERGLETEPAARTQILQGITTVGLGPDGGSPWPIAEYLKRRADKPASVNVLLFAGHATVRQKVMGSDYKRHATEAEIQKMAAMVEQGMRDGAVGLSTGLEYDMGNPASIEEVIALSKVAAKFGGIYMSHIRDEADETIKALEEAIRIGREAKIPVQISHIKLGTVSVWNKASQVVALIEAARKSGLDITADCYPYEAWHSTITVLVPNRKHDDWASVKRGLDDVGGPGNVLIANCSAHRDYEGKTLEEIARDRFARPEQVYMDIVKDGGASVVCRSMQEADIRTFYQQPWVMVSSDGGIGMRHPRGAGTFPKVLGQFVREKNWFPLEEAIRKMSALPAQRLKLSDRGMLKVGLKADVVVFDSANVMDQATMTSPFLEPVGISFVLVNGRLVVDGGKVTSELPGQVIRRR